MRNQEKLMAKAVYIASQSHLKALDRGKKAYIKHPLRIMFSVGDDPELQQIAVLHDVLEDDPSITVEHLRREGFSERVLDALITLTHVKGEDYNAYIERVSVNMDATRVKLLDLEDNMDLLRLSQVTDKDQARADKYKKAKVYLMQSAKTLTEQKSDNSVKKHVCSDNVGLR